MVTGIQVAQREAADETGASAISLAPRNVDRMIEDSEGALALAEGLVSLVADLHKQRSAEKARALSIGLRATLFTDLNEEAALLQAHAARNADDPQATELVKAIEKTKDKHVALRDLAGPVIGGLRAITEGRLPTRLSRFVLAANALGEFIRMHIFFKREALFPLLAGMRITSSARPAEDTKAE